MNIYLIRLLFNLLTFQIYSNNSHSSRLGLYPTKTSQIIIISQHTQEYLHQWKWDNKRLHSHILHINALNSIDHLFGTFIKSSNQIYKSYYLTFCYLRQQTPISLYFSQRILSKSSSIRVYQKYNLVHNYHCILKRRNISKIQYQWTDD